MQSFVKEVGRAAVIDANSVNTDLILPKQFLKNILKTGFGKYLFWDWRYLADGQKNPDFVLNQKDHQGVSILITGDNFGSGSSREHAVWALTDFGFRAVIAGSFSDIFYMNATKNGLLPIVLPKADRDILMTVAADETITIDLVNQVVAMADRHFHFDINPQWKEKFLKGEDDIDLTMKYADQIQAYEDQRQVLV
ncbi:3-isopropylmalate dehydratase small subunit [Fructobacillus evanidus]|uniref:3-isopropylmalate dehydratase small subunit n=1 Tax=Fructobacillus evanidus TaxID=3064281 RepID=A0ABN9YMQ6_9LACO|nr:3-isopropylmalate dehydratase small subunit (LeuD) [Fructobacillus sp. LMG 32999]CAK1232191.1 3-isopropylmalate dehydratase small subunit (LeuD) [Fructobacillus sp. LMG 32999]CAK1232445.1 3-isopropylmalate dehydratase small subunit (LeuD) [Fructobacillus sp. LMG 32999]CAK1236452.1 3-isopropylmalate dehydratase small subunit (LeuD) [Fructobacillus sp. LMG 32999]CAK1238061.1 3-isopropylmalate dehydratase small subunit (LeuD) [Fructobacillus sp. LMG 32999]